MQTYDVLLGSAAATPQYGWIGMAGHKRIALDLTHPQTICLVGAQGSGKSYTASSIVEMALAQSGVNRLPAPLAAVIFHAHRSESYHRNSRRCSSRMPAPRRSSSVCVTVRTWPD